MAKVPAFGYATYWLELDSEAKADKELSAEQDFFMENQYMSVEFDKETGFIKSLVDKNTGVDYASENFLAIPTVIEDSKTDTWAHNVFKFHDVKGFMELQSIERIESGALRSVIRTKHKFNDSYLTQDFILESESKLIRIKCRILWQEPLTMLKMPVTVGGENPVSTYEIPGGIIKRPCNGEEEPALTWGDVTADGKGVALISDAKYSYDCPGNTLKLTMLRNSIFADHYSHRPDADFSYCDEGIHRFEYAVYPHAGDAENSEVQKLALQLNSKLVAVPVRYHKGEMPREKSFISISKSNIRLDAFKFCEDGSGDIVMRLREVDGKAVKTAIVCDIADAGFYADFNKFEIKTFRVDSEGYVTETDFLEGTVEY
jgi:alpha-mannosidase